MRNVIEYTVEVLLDDNTKITYESDEIASANFSENGLLLQIAFKDGSDMTYAGFKFTILKTTKK